MESNCARKATRGWQPDSNNGMLRAATHTISLGKGKGAAMFLILAIVLVVLWLGGFFLFHTAGFLIHLLLLFAIISLVLHFVTGRRTV